GCGARTKGTSPAGLEPAQTFGPGIEALLGYFHERHHVGYERLVETCREVFGVTISEGGIDQALGRLAKTGAADLRGDRRPSAGRAGDWLGRDRRPGGR